MIALFLVSMNVIDITFEFEGKKYSGSLHQVSGAGSSAMFHLMINKYYWGRLRFSDFTGDWVFEGNKPGMENLAGELGYYVTAWFDSH